MESDFISKVKHVLATGFQDIDWVLHGLTGSGFKLGIEL